MLKKKNIIILLIVAGLLFSSVAFWQGLVVKSYVLETKLVNAPVRMVVIADLHSTIYGKNQKNLVKKIEKEQPDIIMLVGDIADDIVPHDGTKQLLRSIAPKYPCYYVTGNHEYLSCEAQQIKEWIADLGVNVLSNQSEIITINNQKIQISGIDDPDLFLSDEEWFYSFGQAPKKWVEKLDELNNEVASDAYSILLTHRPELTQHYKNTSFDLILSGHAHGGQVRVPFILNGLYAPNQSLFPDYAGGEYDLNGTKMIVSRGLIKNELPRVFNPPELVVVDIAAKKN